MEFSFYEEADVKAYLEMMRDVPRYVEDTLAYTRKQAELGYFMPDVSAQSTLPKWARGQPSGAGRSRKVQPPSTET